MEIKVLLFGVLAENCQSREISFSNVANTSELREQFEKRYPLVSGMKYFISVNKNIIHGNTSIGMNSEVALLPPFSGG